MKNILLFSLLFFTTKVLATSQIPDLLISQGDTLSIHANPLELYFDKIGERKLPDLKGSYSTACWRGYLAIWELRHDSLFLKKVTSCSPSYDSIQDANLAKMFGDQFQNNEVFADWVGIEIIHPFGKMLKYFHSGYDSIYEWEMGLFFEKGQLKETLVYDNRASRTTTLSENSDSLLHFLYKNIDWYNLPPLGDKEKKMGIVNFKINDLGRIENIKVVRGINPQYDAEMERLVELIGEWEVYFKKGKAVPINWNLPIRFEMIYYEKKMMGK